MPCCAPCRSGSPSGRRPACTASRVTVTGQPSAAGRDLAEGEVDHLVQAERHATGAGPLDLFIAYGRSCLAEALLEVPVIELFQPNARLADQGLGGAVR